MRSFEDLAKVGHVLPGIAGQRPAFHLNESKFGRDLFDGNLSFALLFFFFIRFRANIILFERKLQ